MQQWKIKLSSWIKLHYPTLIGVVVGAIAGYLYHLQVVCTEDACPITANPYKTTILFGVMGGILGSYFDRKPKAIK
jgi:hypothetical protein